MGMTDVTEKLVIRRQAAASGKIYLSPGTIQKIDQGEVMKGNPLLVAEIAAMNAAKRTHLLIPHCHQIPLDAVQVSFQSEGWVYVDKPGKAWNRRGKESAFSS